MRTPSSAAPRGRTATDRGARTRARPCGPSSRGPRTRRRACRPGARAFRTEPADAVPGHSRTATRGPGPRAGARDAEVPAAVLSHERVPERTGIAPHRRLVRHRMIERERDEDDE